MEHAEQAIQQGQGDGEDGARDIVGLAHDSITTLGKKEGAVILGSSTICLGLVRPGGLLEMANVGDSGFRVIRGAETVFASEVGCLHGCIAGMRRLLHSQALLLGDSRDKGAVRGLACARQVVKKVILVGLIEHWVCCMEQDRGHLHR